MRHDVMRCRELFAHLSEYLDGELPVALCDEFARHVEGCEPCEQFIRTLERTIALCRQVPRRPVPDAVRRELLAILERAARQRPG